MPRVFRELLRTGSVVVSTGLIRASIPWRAAAYLESLFGRPVGVPVDGGGIPLCYDVVHE